MNSVRGRITLLILSLLVLVLGSAGYALDRQLRQSEREAFDTRMERTLNLSEDTANAALLEELPEGDRRLDAVLRADDSTLRLTLAGRFVYRAGASLPAGAPAQVPLGLSSRVLGGHSYRILSRQIGESSVARLDLFADLRSLERRERERRNRIIGVLAVTLLLAATGTLLSAELVLRPLSQLRRLTSEIAAERDLARRVPADRGLREIRALAGSFNAMLARLQRSAVQRERALNATRRFTADAGHELRTPMTAMGATLALLGRPDLPDTQRAELAAEAQAQQERFETLLAGLSALARGDAGPHTRAPVDLAEVADQVLAETRAGGSGGRVDAVLPDGAVWVRGWEPGLRLLVQNLVRNALIHAGPQAAVRVTLAAPGDGVVLTVEDDGPGIPAADRQRIFEPFARGGDGSRPGSGLGLALVAQQAGQHQAQVVVDDSPALGGARFTVTFPPGSAPTG